MSFRGASLLTQKSLNLVIFELLDTEHALEKLLNQGVLSRDEGEKVRSALPDKRNANKELIHALCNGGEPTFSSFLLQLKRLKEEDEDQAIQTLTDILEKTFAFISSSPNNTLPDKPEIHMGIDIKLGRNETGDTDGMVTRVFHILVEEVKKAQQGSCKQWFLKQYGLLIMDVEVQIRTMFCQLQITSKHSQIVKKVEDGSMAKDLWAHLCRTESFASFGKKASLSLTLQQMDPEDLKHFHRGQRGQIEDEATPHRTTVAASLSGPTGSSLVAQEESELIRLSEMSDAQKVMWRLLLSQVTSTSFKNVTFYRTLRKCKLKTNVKMLSSDDGFTILHEIIRNKRADLMPSLLYSGLLIDLYHQEVGRIFGGEYAGLSPVDLTDRYTAVSERSAMEFNMRMAHSLQKNPLKKACRDGKVKEFQVEMRKAAYSIGSAADGMSCLHWAVVSGSHDMVTTVTKLEKKVGHERSEEETVQVILLAVTLGNSHLIDPLIEHNPIPEIDIDGKKLIEKIAEYGDIKAFISLTSRNVPVHETVLAIAATSGNVEFVRFCLQEHCPPLDVNFKDRRQKTALHFATERGHVAIMECLLMNGADMKARDKRGRTFLHSAAENGQIEVLNLAVRFLEERNILDDFLSSPDKHLGSELCYLIRGRDQGQPAWHYIYVDRGLLDTFRIKTRGGAVDVADYGRVIKSGWGTNPSHDEAQEVEGRFDMAHISPTAASDMLPLHVAILKQNTEAALRLIELMSVTSISHPDCFSLTPLHHACMRGNVPIVASLVDKGANRSALDHKQRSIDNIAALNEHGAILEYLGSGSLVASTRSFVQAHIAPLMDSFSEEEINRQLNLGQDIKQYIRRILRDLNSDINTFLFDVLHAGPVMEETESES